MAIVAALAALNTTTRVFAQAAPAQPNFQLPAGGLGNAPLFQAPPIPAAAPITPNGAVVEDVIARVNDRIITRTEFERSQEGLVQEAKQENWSQSEFSDKQRNLLRDMIDQQLLLSKGKELGITGDAETIRQLDEIRKRANLPDLEALQKAAEQQGASFEDFKQNIRNQSITQQVVRDEVGRRINITNGVEQAYYSKHSADFQQPEQVHLSEILVPTAENATDAQISEAQIKADAVEAKLKAGGSFTELAKSSSGGPTASAGGDLGDFKRGMLGDVLETATFPLPVGQFTAPIRTRQGFVILRVDSHQAAGTPPLQQVEGQVQEAIYMSQLQPALRSYLTQAREDAFVEIKPGFTDSGSNHADSKMAFTTYTPPPLKKKIVKHQAAEQERAVKAEQQLTAARQKLAEKQQAKDAASASRGGVRNASTSRKPAKIHREKVRYGQAPRNALPNGPTEVAGAVPSLGAAPADPNKVLGEAPGAAMGSPTQSITTISTGTGEQTDQDPLAPKPTSGRKTRFGSRETDSEEKHAQVKLASAEVKANKRPTAATAEESADEKVQAAPLGLAESGKSKKHKTKRPKDEPKERLQEKPKPVQAPTTIDQTVNPALGTGATGAGTVSSDDREKSTTPSADRSVLPPAATTPQNPAAPGQPIPAVTDAQPNAPNTTAQPPQ
ncbi:MAG: peptidylprolyl isomerase [Janthinobacterium lividum]